MSRLVVTFISVLLCGMQGRYYATADGHLVRDPHLDRVLDRRQRGKLIVLGVALAAVCIATMVLLHTLADRQLRDIDGVPA